MQSAFSPGKRYTEQPLVSIITACFNAAQTLPATIASVAAQTDQRYEYIVVDGGSADQSREVIEAHLMHIDAYLSEPDAGMYHAMNKGAALARGQYLAFLNADDAYLPHTIAAVVGSEQFGKAAVLHGNLLKLRSIDGQVYEREERPRPEFMPRGMGIFHPASFVAAGAFRQMGGYDTRYRLAADYALFLGLWQQERPFFHIDKPLAYFSTGGRSNSGCGTYSEAVRIQRALCTGTAHATELLLWKCRLRRLALRWVEGAARITGLTAALNRKRASRWA
jgi:glycosyltransferase involved in cell wall biosynthesis